MSETIAKTYERLRSDMINGYPTDVWAIVDRCLSQGGRTPTEAEVLDFLITATFDAMIYCEQFLKKDAAGN